MTRAASRVLLAGGLGLFSWAAQAQSVPPAGGLRAGSLIVRASVIGILPEDRNSTVSLIGGHIDVDDTVSPAFDLSYFVTDHIAIGATTGFLRTSLSAHDTLLGTVPIGKISSVPLVVTAEYHFLPNYRFNPYIGAGVAAAWYYDANPEGPLVQTFGVDAAAGAALQIGVDYQISGPWYGNFDIKQLFLSAHARINHGEVTADTDIDPLIIGAGTRLPLLKRD